MLLLLKKNILERWPSWKRTDNSKMENPPQGRVMICITPPPRDTILSLHVWWERIVTLYQPKVITLWITRGSETYVTWIQNIVYFVKIETLIVSAHHRIISHWHVPFLPFSQQFLLFCPKRQLRNKHTIPMFL